MSLCLSSDHFSDKSGKNRLIQGGLPKRKTHSAQKSGTGFFFFNSMQKYSFVRAVDYLEGQENIKPYRLFQNHSNSSLEKGQFAKVLFFKIVWQRAAVS